MEKVFTIYIMSNKKRGTLYIGMSGNLPRRVWEHKEKVVNGFTKKYGLDLLVYYECHDTPEGAALRERQIKAWKRAWKIELIEKENPEWKDLCETIF